MGFKEGKKKIRTFFLNNVVLNDYWVLKRKKIKIFFLNNVDVENCGDSKGFGFIYIYIDKCPRG